MRRLAGIGPAACLLPWLLPRFGNSDSFAQIIDETRESLTAACLVPHAQNRRRVHCGERPMPVGEGKDFAARLGQHHGSLQDLTRGDRAERDDELRSDERQFPIQPPAAGLHFATIGMFVEAALAALLVLEVLYRIRDIGRGTIEPRRGEAFVEDAPSRSDERTAGAVFLIAGLFADQHDERADRAFAEHGLGRVAVKRTALAMRRLSRDFPQLRRCLSQIDRNRRLPIGRLRGFYHGILRKVIFRASELGA